MKRLLTRILKAVLLLLVLLVSAFVGFYFWASSGRLDDGELSSVRTVDGASPPSPGDSFVVATYNVGYFSGLSNNQAVHPDRAFFEANEAAARRFVDWLDADILALQEVDLDSARSYHVDQAVLLAAAAGMGWTALAINWDKRYVPFPYWPPSVQFGRMLSGQAVLSRYPIVGADRVVLQERGDAPFWYRAFYLDRLAQVARIDLGGRELFVINVHLEAFDQATRQAQVGTVLEIYREHADRPTILLGDFNSVPPQATRKRGFADEPETDFSTDETIARVLAEPGIAEAIPSDVYAGDEVRTFTFASDAPSRRLDYIFYSAERIERLEWHVASEAGSISDHLPVVMRFRFREPAP